MSNPALSFFGDARGRGGSAGTQGPTLVEPAAVLPLQVAQKPHPTRGKTLAPEVLTEPEVRALLRACSKRAITGIRNKALLAILWRTGIRISEALDLMPFDVDTERGTVRVRKGKGLKPRTTALSNLDCLPLLEAPKGL